MCIESVNAVCSRMSRATALSVLAVFLGTGGIAQGQIIIPGADGSDGPLNCGTLQGNPDFPCGVPCASGGTYTIDLSAAASRAWDAPSEVQGHGVYDYEEWAVVFKYSCVDIPADVTIEFTNHPSDAPVVWLVSGDVEINGTIELGGEDGTGESNLAEPGPGGFRGGSRWLSEASVGSAGLGPGGGSNLSCRDHGSFGEPGWSECGDPGPTYGNARLIPLIGGSGGSNTGSRGGGAGGGAILIACAGTISLSGEILANRGYAYSGYYGSGGGIRLVADSVVDGSNGPATLRAQGTSNDGAGRIRIEANSIQLANATDPALTSGYPGDTAVLWPSDLGGVPSVRVVSVSGVSVPTDPRASFDFPQSDVTLTSPGVQPLVVEASNVPLDWIVDVRVVPKQGQDLMFQAFYVSGDELASVWQAAVQVSSGFSAIQARAHKAGTRTSDEASSDDDVDALPENNAEHKD